MYDCYLVCKQVNRRHHTEKAVASSNRSSKKLMSKLLKYHVIGGAIDGQQSSGSVEGAAPVPNETALRPPPRSEPDIFQLPPLPDTQPSADAASAR